jgi:hypothetical protein
MTGRTTTSYGLNGSQTRSSAASNRIKRSKTRNRKIKIKRGAHSRLEEGTSTASYQPRPPTRRAPLQRKISLLLPRKTSWLQHLLATRAQSFNSESSIQQQPIAAQPKIAKSSAAERKQKIRKKRKKRM